MKELAKDNGFVFMVSHEFKGEFLSPLIDNLKVKYQNNYDDYNEVYHCNKLIHVLAADKDVNVDYHVMYQGPDCVGLALISTGKIDAIKYFDQPLFNKDAANIVLNYFHVAPNARGNGTNWLKNIILPYYQDKDYLYVKSSHEKAFSLYERLGQTISSYESMSDNNKFKRNGKIFKIKVKQ